MKLTLKLAAGFVIGMTVVLFLHGISHVRFSATLLENDSRSDHLAIGHTLAIAVANAWLERGSRRAVAIVEAVNRAKTHIAIRWVPRAGAGSGLHRGLTEGERRRVRAGEEISVVSPGHGVVERTRISYVPVRVGGAVEGAVELVETLENERRFVENIVWRTGLTGLLIAAVCGAMSLGLGYALVGRRVGHLIAMARRVGQGDFGGRLASSSRDELGRLAEEMNLMIQQLAETSDRLGAETRERIAAIEQLRHADRLSTVGQLAAGMAHELGTPLQVISGRARLVVREDLTVAETKESAVVIVEQTERISRIIRQLLDFARRRAPQKVLRDLVPVVESTVELLRPIAGRRGVTITVRRAAEALELEADASQIEQVLTNLVMNGLQSMPTGGELVVELGRGRVRPPADLGAVASEHVYISVADRGTGIPEEILPRIFEPFFTTKEVGEGTGLGLSVSYGIVRDHGGWIAVENGPERGSRFTIFLPVPHHPDAA